MASRGGAFALVALCLLELATQGAGREPLVPAMFVFGDSTVDVGNNNFLPDCVVDCKANHPRYGVDYPYQSPTGRFSNGYNLADHLAQQVGFNESPPALLSLPAESIIAQMYRGVNFASGGSGLLENTGRSVCHQVLNMTAQVERFSSLAGMMGPGAADLIAKSLIFISAGSNDLFEYADALSSNRNDAEFLQSLIAPYRSYLKEWYKAGARKFVVVTPSLVGCCPSQRLIAQQAKDVDKLGCFGTANNLSKQLYPMVASMLDDLNLELRGMNYSLCDSAGMAEFVLNNTGGGTPGTNFTVVDTACCGSGQFGAGACNFSASLCQNRTNYLFWDNYHPTDAASNLAATELFTDGGFFVHPINVQQLVALRP